MLKKYVLGLLLLFWGGYLLYGCGKGNENVSIDEKNIPTSSIVPSSDEALTGAKDDKNSVKEDENVSENQKEAGDNNQAQETDSAFELLKNYREKGIPSVHTEENKGEIYSNAFLNEEREIEYYTYKKEQDCYYIWKYTLKEGITEEAASGEPDFWIYKNGTAWMREPVLWPGIIKAEEMGYNGLVVFRGEDQNDYAWYIGNDKKAHLIKRAGDSYDEIPISEWRITDPDHATVAVLENGDVVMADLGKECFVYNPEDGSLRNSFQCGWYESICVCGNVIYITTRDGSSVQRYDAQNQEFLPTIEADFNNSVRIAKQEDDIYVCTPGGFFRAKENGKSFQKVLEAGNFHFAKEEGILLKCFVIGDAFYVVYGENGVNIKKYAPAGEEDEASKTLTVYSLRSNDIILDMISEFQDQYPDIELLYETGEGADGSLTLSDHIRALNARILAGDGPDILLLDGLPTKSYIDKGILEDLNPVLGDRKEELLDNILSVYTNDEKMYMLPLRIIIPMFMTSGQKPEIYSTLEALVEYSEAEGGVANMGYSYANILQILYYNYTPDILSVDGTVDKEAVKEFLSLAKRFCESEGVTENAPWDFPYLEGYNRTAFLFAKKEADLGFLIVNGGYELADAPAAAKERGGELVANQKIFFPNGLLGINHLSAKKELAHLFARFAFSYEIQKRDVWDVGYPINIKRLDEYANMDLSEITQGDATVSLRFFTAEESEQMVKVVKEACTPIEVEENFWEIFLDTVEDYLKGTKTLEKSVDEFSERLQLYLYEQ